MPEKEAANAAPSVIDKAKLSAIVRIPARAARWCARRSWACYVLGYAASCEAMHRFLVSSGLAAEADAGSLGLAMLLGAALLAVPAGIAFAFVLGLVAGPDHDARL